MNYSVEIRSNRIKITILILILDNIGSSNSKLNDCQLESEQTINNLRKSIQQLQLNYFMESQRCDKEIHRLTQMNINLNEQNIMMRRN